MHRLILSLALLLPAAAAAESGFGFARATSQLGGDSPLNLFDGRISTAWCEGAKGDGVGERVVIGFKAPVTIDEVRVVNGDTRSRKAFSARNRSQKLELRDESSRHVLSLADKGQEQVIRLATPMETDRLEVELLSVFPGTEGESACLAELAFFAQGRPILDSKSVPRATRDGVAELMGRWYGGSRGARDRFLDFYADGTYRYLHRPFDPEEPEHESRGEFTFDGKVLKVRAGKGEESRAFAASLGEEAANDGTRRTRLLISASLEEELAGQWSDAP